VASVERPDTPIAEHGRFADPMMFWSDPDERSGQGPFGRRTTQGDPNMWTIVVVLLVLWVLGFVTSNTLGGLLHLLLVIAIIVMAVRLLQGRKVL
jgi:hypothetical protein